MHSALLWLYGGPDQIMTLTSGLASVVGLLLVFWNRVVVLFYRVMGKARPSAGEPPAGAKNN